MLTTRSIVAAAQFADEDRVRILAQGRVERIRETCTVHADLALADQAQLALMDELDRILDREDVALDLGVDRIDNGSQSRGFPRASFTGHENKAARGRRELVQRFRHLELFERQALGGNASKYGADAIQMPKHVDAEASNIGNHVGKVGRVVLVELLDRLLRHDLEQLCT
jgi:hypothetical protein